MNTEAIISAVIFTALILYISIRYGVQKSISHSYYVKKNPNLFPTALALFAVFAILADPTILMIIAGSGVILVAVFADYRQAKMYNFAHYSGAFLAIIAGMSHVWITGYWQLVVLFVLASVALRLFARNYIFWVECVAFYVVLFVLL